MHTLTHPSTPFSGKLSSIATLGVCSVVVVVVVLPAVRCFPTLPANVWCASVISTGMDLPLLEWLETYTFPCEARFSDPKFARSVYEKAVRRHIMNGTTTCAWFGSLHLEASKILVDVVREQGQRAHVGKVSMDRNSPDYYIEETEQGIADVESFVRYVHETSPVGPTSTTSNSAAAAMGEAPASSSSESEPDTPPKKSAAALPPFPPSAGASGVGADLVTPTIIPRFVPSCTSRMMSALGQMSSQYCLPVHSHLSESPNEIAWVKELHPEAANYADVYYQHGLLHDRSYMAHCVHCNKGERLLMKNTGAGVVHCPSSNFMLKSGVLDVRRLLVEGVKVGLGSDIAGGCSSSMLESIRQCVIASRTASFGRPLNEDANVAPQAPAAETVPRSDPLNYSEAFHLATMGGADVLGLKDTVGNFEAGKSLDALMIDPAVANGAFDLFGSENASQIFEKFLFLGDDRNINRVYVAGREIFRQTEVNVAAQA